MATRLIQQRQLRDDTWRRQASPSSPPDAPHDAAGVASLSAPPAPGDWLLSLPEWQSQAAAWRAWRAASAGTLRLGVQLEPADDPAVLSDDLGELSLIAVNFPSYTDGRGYSIARLLRERYGFAGEIRAVGDVFRDQLFYLSRVGFDAFLLREGEVAEEALSSLDDFSEAYQTSVERPEPLFRRRLA